MNTVLDGQSLFDEQELKVEPGSLSRGSIERTMPGLDGVLSIDLGGCGRKVKQSGVLRAKSRSQMSERIDAISAYMDGSTHTLVTEDGQEFGNLRMDVFKVGKDRTSGGGVAVDYEIVYTQLMV